MASHGLDSGYISGTGRPHVWRGLMLPLNRALAAPQVIFCPSELLERRIEMQLNDIHTELARARIFTPVFPCKNLFASIIRKTSRYAISLLVKQHEKVRRATDQAPMAPCTNLFSMTMGLPCAHRIAELVNSGCLIYLEEIHPFWRMEACPVAYEHSIFCRTQLSELPC